MLIVCTLQHVQLFQMLNLSHDISMHGSQILHSPKALKTYVHVNWAPEQMRKRWKL